VVNPVINRMNPSETPTTIECRGVQLNRAEQLLAFRRGSDKPIVLDRIKNNSRLVSPHGVFVDKDGELLLEYYLEGPVPAAPSRVMLTSWKKDGKTYTAKDTTLPFYVIGFHQADSTAIGRLYPNVRDPDVRYSKAALDHDGGRIGFSMKIAKWKYLEGRQETVRICLDDLFEVRGQKAVLKAKKPSPIAEEKPASSASDHDTP
jgi:hypothetical protein